MPVLDPFNPKPEHAFAGSLLHVDAKKHHVRASYCMHRKWADLVVSSHSSAPSAEMFRPAIWADAPPRVAPQSWFLDQVSRSANRHWVRIFVDGGPISKEVVGSNFLGKAGGASGAGLHLRDRPWIRAAT